MKTPVKDRADVGYYCARFVFHDVADDIDGVAYSGPGVKVCIHTWNTTDRSAILQALNAAYMAGANSVREVIRRELGVKDPDLDRDSNVVYELK